MGTIMGTGRGGQAYITYDVADRPAVEVAAAAADQPPVAIAVAGAGENRERRGEDTPPLLGCTSALERFFVGRKEKAHNISTQTTLLTFFPSVYPESRPRQQIPVWERLPRFELDRDS
jgi:hypothetical protein